MKMKSECALPLFHLIVSLSSHDEQRQQQYTVALLPHHISTIPSSSPHQRRIQILPLLHPLPNHLRTLNQSIHRLQQFLLLHPRPTQTHTIRKPTIPLRPLQTALIPRHNKHVSKRDSKIKLLQRNRSESFGKDAMRDEDGWKTEIGEKPACEARVVAG